MTEMIKIAAQPRERAGKGAARAARRAGHVPGVIYGDKKEPALIQVDPQQLDREIKKPTFFTTVYEVDIAGTVERVLPRDVQFHPVTDRPEHVDLMRVSPGTRIRVTVPVHFLNQDKSPGLKRGGVLNIVRHGIEVYCRADAIPGYFEINLEGTEIGDSIHISAVKLPEDVRPTITTRDFTVATVAAPSVMKSAEEEAADAAKSASAEPAAGAAAGGAAAGGAAPAKGAAPAAEKKPAAKK